MKRIGIGRFTQLDPLTWDYPELTNYQYASNEPIANVDMDGLEAIGSTVASSVVDAIVTNASFLSEIVIKMPAKSALVSGFKSFSNFSSPLGFLANLIPENSTGEKVVGSLVGVGEAANDAVMGSYQMIRHPLNTIQGVANLGTQAGQIDAMVNISANYVESRSEYGESFTNSRYVSYGVTSVAIAIAGPKYIRGAKVVTQATKTSTTLVQANRTAGNLFRDELAAALRAEGRTVETEVYKWTPFGKRYIDIDVWHNGVNLGGIETKVGGSRYLPLQRLKDAWLGAQEKPYPIQLVRKPTNW